MAEASVVADLIPIESNTRTIQTCFQQCLYEVPSFQRPYSWAQDQLVDFWDDVILAKGDFFFGSTVTWVSKKRDLFNDSYSIIDGQQRLTTSAILLSVVRDAFYKVAESSKESDLAAAKAATSQAAATQKYLLIHDDDGNEYRVITRSEDMFYEKIQNPGAIPSGAKWNGSAVQIGAARTFFESKVLAAIEGLSYDDQIEQLKTIRANSLKARVIQVELASEEDGFLVFETLNTRGADLRLADLIKNLLIRGGSKNAADRNAISVRWERLVDCVESSRDNADVVDRFIWQSWNSRRDALREPELFKEISKSVAGKPEAHLKVLEELEADSSIYQWLEDANIQVQVPKLGVRNPFAVPEFIDSVRALAIFNVSVANSTLLAVARKYAETTLMSRKQLIQVMRLVENFHFQFTALTNSGSTGGTRARYNRFAVRLEHAKSSQAVAAEIDDLRTKLRASLPPQKQTDTAFRELFYAPSIRLKQSQKVRSSKVFIAYVLMSFAKHHKLLPAGTDPLAWSIEHIKPQAAASGKYDDPVYSIGNLTLLTSGLNSDIGDSDVPTKMPFLEQGSAYFDAVLMKWKDSGADAPTDSQIADRAAVLAIEALKDVWGV